MRKVLFVIALVCSLLLMVQCSGDETLSSFDGKVELVTSPVAKSYIFRPSQYSFQMDSLRWEYGFASGKESKVSLVISGKIQTDTLLINDNDSIIGIEPREIGQNHLNLGLETYIGTNTSIVQVEFDSNGNFFDTVQIASTSVSELILPQNSRMFVSADTLLSDTITLINPHSLKK
jgi:hypothetical protein